MSFSRVFFIVMLCVNLKKKIIVFTSCSDVGRQCWEGRECRIKEKEEGKDEEKMHFDYEKISSFDPFIFVGE